LIDENIQLRERNSQAVAEIERLSRVNDQRNRECNELQAKIKSLEYQVSQALGRVDDLTRVLDQKTADLR
jgi:hypothetical protein